MAGCFSSQNIDIFTLDMMLVDGKSFLRSQKDLKLKKAPLLNVLSLQSDVSSCKTDTTTQSKSVL